MTLSIIIPTYNRNEMLCTTLSNVLQYENQYAELIVVDQTKEHDQDTAKFLNILTREKKNNPYSFRLPQPS
jgi:glycosyltransferase involved in cell wall biosynthesis